MKQIAIVKLVHMNGSRRIASGIVNRRRLRVFLSSSWTSSARRLPQQPLASPWCSCKQRETVNKEDFELHRPSFVSTCQLLVVFSLFLAGLVPHFAKLLSDLAERRGRVVLLNILAFFRAACV